MSTRKTLSDHLEDPKETPRREGKEVARETANRNEGGQRNRRRSAYRVGDDDEKEVGDEERSLFWHSFLRSPNPAKKSEIVTEDEDDEVKVNVWTPSNSSEKSEVDTRGRKSHSASLEVEKSDMKGNRSFWTWMWKKKDKKEKSVVKSNDKKSSKTQMKVKEKKEDKEKSKGKKKTSKKGKEKESNGGEGEEEEKETGETKPPAPIDNRVVALAVFIATFTTATNFFLPGVFNVESSSKGPADNSNSIGSGYVTGWKICNMFALINAMCVLLIQATLIAPFHTPMTEKITKEMGNFLLWIATGFMVGGFMAIMHGISYAVKENLPRQLATFSVVYVAIIMATMIFLKFWAIYWCVKAYLNKRKEEKEKKKKEEEDEE